MRPFPAARVAGFSLVELLVCIGVIAVLAGLVLPAFQRARNMAATTNCAAHLRTLAGAYAQYRQENTGHSLPISVTSSDPRSEGHNFYGLSLLRAYYRSGPPYNWNPDGSRIHEPTEMCPGAAITGQTLNRASGGPDYGLMVKTGVNFETYFSNQPMVPLLWDAWVPTGGTPTTIPLRHNGGINMAFLDTHVEYVPGGDGRIYSGYFDSIYRYGHVLPSYPGSGTYVGTTKKQP